MANRKTAKKKNKQIETKQTNLLTEYFKKINEKESINGKEVPK